MWSSKYSYRDPQNGSHDFGNLHVAGGRDDILDLSPEASQPRSQKNSVAF